MGVQIKWLTKEKKGLVITYIHPWSWGDLHEATTKATALVEGTDHIVHMVADLTEAGSPPDYNILSQLSEIQFPANADLNIIINAPTFLRSIINIAVHTIARSKRDKTYFVSSLEEAKQVIVEYEQRASLEVS